MFLALAEAGLVYMRHGRTTTVTGESDGDARASGRQRLNRTQSGHDCKLSGCKPHVCKPMAKSTIRNIHSILSGAFEAAERWEWSTGIPPIPPDPHGAAEEETRNAARRRRERDRPGPGHRSA